MNPSHNFNLRQSVGDPAAPIDGSWVLDNSTGEIFWTDETYAIFEINRSVRPSKDLFYAMTHPDDVDRITAALLESIARRTPYYVEHRIVMADGRIKHVAESGRTHYDESGAPLLTIGTVHDVTRQGIVPADSVNALRKLAALSADQRRAVAMLIDLLYKDPATLPDNVVRMRHD